MNLQRGYQLPLSLYVKSVLLFFYTQNVFAAGSSHTNEIPWSLIQAQSFNFIFFLTVMILVLRKPVAQYFISFRDTYLEEASKAQKIVAAAEKQKKDIEDQLSKLETTYTSRLETSKKEAQQMKQNLIKEAQDRSARLVEDSKDSANQLFKSAEQIIKNKVLEAAMTTAKADLTKKVDSKESDRLSGEFVEEISVGYL